MSRKFLLPLLTALIVLPAAASEPTAAASPAPASAPAAEKPRGADAAEAPSDEVLERKLQALSWPQFKSVVSAVPKLKSQVDTFGPLGWNYVQMHYKTYPWHKSVAKLDAPQKRELDGLITKAGNGATISQ